MKKKLTIIIIIIVIISGLFAIKIGISRKNYIDNTFNYLNLDNIEKDNGKNKGYILYGELHPTYLKINISNNGNIKYIKKILENDDILLPRLINPNSENTYIIGNTSNDDWFSGFISFINDEGTCEYMIKYTIDSSKKKLIKINSKMQKVWEKTYDYDILIKDKLDFNNNYIIYGNRDEQLFVQKINQKGNIVYELEIDLLSSDIDIHDIYEVNNNEFLVAGDDKDNKRMLLRLDSKGKIIWKQNYEVGPIYNIRILDDKTILLLTDNEILKTDELGNVIWKREYTYTKLKRFLK
ncbi:MAG: hypothetical protein ACOC2W_03015 [bacterium]